MEQKKVFKCNFKKGAYFYVSVAELLSGWYISFLYLFQKIESQIFIQNKKTEMIHNKKIIIQVITSLKSVLIFHPVFFSMKCNEIDIFFVFPLSK